MTRLGDVVRRAVGGLDRESEAGIGTMPSIVGAIAAATATVFLERGYENAAVDGIAARSRVSGLDAYHKSADRHALHLHPARIGGARHGERRFGV